MTSSCSSEISASTVNMANLRVTDASDPVVQIPAAAGKRNSQEPLRKRRRKVTAGMVPLDAGDSNLATQKPAASRSQSPTIRRSVRGRSTTPRRSSRGQTPTANFDPFVSTGNSSEFASRVSPQNVVVENNTITVTKLSAPANFELTKTQETTIQVEGIPYEEDDEGSDDEDYRDFMPGNIPSGSPAMRNGNGTASSRRSTRKQPETIYKVKTGRVSKFKEGSMNDRASTRPPADLIGYAYSKHKGVSQAVSEASHSTSTAVTKSKTAKKDKLSFLPRKYTGDEVFTFGGLITSIFQFRGLEYVKENLLGPKKQKLYDKIHGDLEKMKEQKELDEIKAKAEALYKMRKSKEWKEMEAKRQKATEELRRRKQRELERKERLQQGKPKGNGTSSIGIKRKYGTIAESFGESGQDRAWDEADQAAGDETEEATDVDGDIGSSDNHSETNGPIEVGEDDLSLTDEESEMDEDELAKVQELARSVTGKEIIAQVLPSRSPSITTSLQASPSRRSKFVPSDSIDLMIFSQECEVPEFNQYPASVEHSDLDSDHEGYNSSFLKRPNIGKSSTAPSESGASSSGVKGNTKGKSLQATLKSHASKVFGGQSKGGQSNGDVNGGSFQSAVSMETEVPEQKFTKRQLQKQERCKKKVMDLEAKLLDAWKELEAAGGVSGLGLNSPPPERTNGKPKSNGASSVCADGDRAMGPPPTPGKKSTTM